MELETARLLAGVLVFAFIAGSLRLLLYCLTNDRIRLALFLAAWFLILSTALLRTALISATAEGHARADWADLALAILGFTGTAVFGFLALVYFPTTIWSWRKRRRLASTSALPKDTPAAMRWPEAVLLSLIVLPLLGATWLALETNYTVLVFGRQSDKPVPWLKATAIPPADINARPPNDWGQTSLHTQSPSGKWLPIVFPYESRGRRLAILSPDSVLITFPIWAPPNTIIAAPNPLVGSVYRKGSATPAATLPESFDIAAIPSGGFTTTTCELAPHCQNNFCINYSSLTVRRFDRFGAQTVEATLTVPSDIQPCDWWPVHRLFGDDLVYSVQHCGASSNAPGFYHLSPSGIQRITSRIHSDEYTAIEDKEEMESQTQPVTWYHIPWIPDPL